MTAVNAAVTGDFGSSKPMTSLKVIKEIETDQESNASSEDMEIYSPKSVVVKKPPAPATATAKEVNVSRVRINNPILRIRSEDRKIGEDIGEGFVTKFVTAGNDRVDVMLVSRSNSPLGGKMPVIGAER